ncbi:hypothetical protein FF125_06980 [Aureibaculum algae]|uniref:DUF3575 domain-containing protein n=1 Tax=Aureibaculum algae TaxID=2584122 RepID=A0A5B7TST0_9FLAO|nr:hypothetical protein [Aureibaculum algae]QCX38186.1 hypothetical protein FF125_06980 [Aureibaculum algae]
MKLDEKILIILLLAATAVFGQKTTSLDLLSDAPDNQIEHNYSIGSSFFMLGNLFSDSPDYYLLTFGYQFTKKDKIFAEFNTWKYSEPLGTYGHSDAFYPGYARAFGIGIGYQRFHWKGLFTTVQATPFMKQYYTTNNDKIQKGFQLYFQLIAGYRFEFFKKRWYLEPAYALKYWPVDTNYPSDFAKIENGKPNYIFEPSLNFGFKF